MDIAIWIALAALAVAAAPVCWTLWQRQKLLNERIDTLKAEIREAKETEERHNDAVLDQISKLALQVADLPLDQIQSIYDSEKAFQDGLNEIMTYGKQTFGLNKESVPHEH